MIFSRLFAVVCAAQNISGNGKTAERNGGAARFFAAVKNRRPKLV
ncbi:MAG: hypothetical protein ACR2P5_08380 [Gammaproteobacteria bacterium]